MKRGLMVLIEGLDLAGKSSLARDLISHYEQQGVLLRHSRNSTVPTNEIALVANEFRKETDAGLLETGALFLAAHLLDALTFRLPAVDEIHLQESSWLRTLAYHTLHNTRWIPTFVEQYKSLQPPFDVVIYLTASVGVRQLRVLKREGEEPGKNDQADYLSHFDPDKLVRHDALLQELTTHIYGITLLLDTTEMHPQTVLSQALKTINQHR